MSNTIEMLKSKTDLIANLTIAINKYDNEEVQNFMQKLYLRKKLPIRTIGLTFKGEKTVTSLYEIELGIWCMGLYECTHDEIVNPNKYFSDGEIYEIKEYTNKDPLQMKTDEILLHKVTKEVIKGKVFYICPFVTFNDLLLFDKNSLITYNFETQREAKLTKYQGRIIKAENVNLQSVEEIATLVENDELPISMLTINLRTSEANDKSVILNDDGDLTIKVSFLKEVFADSIDGYHRLKGIVKGTIRANTDNKELTGGVVLLVTSYDPESAQGYIEIQNRQNALKSEQKKAFTKDNINEFVKTLNYTDSKSKNIMYDTIANTLEEVSLYKDKLTTVGILHDGFKLTGLKFGKPYDNENFYLPYFISTFNNILGYYMHEYNDDIKKLKAETIILEPSSFVGMIAIGKEFYGKKNQKQLLNDLLSVASFKRSDYNWENLDLFKKNPKTFSKIYSYFENIAKEVE